MRMLMLLVKTIGKHKARSSDGEKEKGSFPHNLSSTVL